MRGLVRVSLPATTNRHWDERGEILAVLPRGQVVSVIGPTTASGWLNVRTSLPPVDVVNKPDLAADPQVHGAVDDDAANLEIARQRRDNIVTRVPLRMMGYSHVGTFLYFDHKGNISNDRGHWFRFLDGAEGRIAYLGALEPDDATDHRTARGYLPHLARQQNPFV